MVMFAIWVRKYEVENIATRVRLRINSIYREGDVLILSDKNRVK